MLKSTPPTKKPSGKARKYLSYREAWTRIKEAQEQGFYLEAVTLVESIISDRLVSYLVSVGEMDVAGRYVSLSALIRRWKERKPESISFGGYSDLQAAVDHWRQLRNNVIHGMVKSPPDTEPDDPVDFIAKAREAAATGEKLAKAVSRWRDKQKTA